MKNPSIRALGQLRGGNAPILVATVGLASLVGGLIGLGDRLQSSASFGITLVLLIAFGVFALLRSATLCRASLRDGLGWTSLVSGLVGASMLVAVGLSGFQLATGLRESKLAELGLPVADPRAAVAQAFLVFLVAGAALLAGEQLAALTKARVRRRPLGEDSRFETKRAYYALICLAIIGFVLAGGRSQQETFNSRAAAGVGISSLLASAYVLAVSIGVLQRHWGSRALAACSLGLVTVGLLLGGTRTPLAIAGTAVLLRLIVQTAPTKHTFRLIVVGTVMAYASVVLLVGVATWRGAVAEKGSASLSATLVEVAPNPFAGLSAGGLDTLDGLILARQVDREAVGAHVTDPAKALTTFVPRVLWPEKPLFLGNSISTYYTSFGGNSGLFLSGAGYGYIVFVGVAGMASMFLVLGYVFEAAYRSMRVGSIWTVLITYFAVRFFFAGDAFDAHHVLGLCLLMGVAYGIGQAASGVLPAKQADIAA